MNSIAQIHEQNLFIDALADMICQYKEFACYEALENIHDIKVYFADLFLEL